MIRLARPLLDSQESDAVCRVLESGWLVQGERVANFEGLLASRIGAQHVLACTSGTAAIQLAIAALCLPEGSKIAVPSYTFPSPINIILLARHQPVLVDVDPSTCNLDEDDFARALDDHPDLAALIAVHQFGLPAPLPTLMPVLNERGIAVVEDAACALGSALRMDGEWVGAGAVGALGCFSFHPRKVITTGEGGAVSTDDETLAERVRSLRDHGRGAHSDTGAMEFQRAGWNLRLSEIHAAIGEVQMNRLDELLSDRARIAAGYNERLAALESRGLGLPRVPDDVRPNWQTYVVRLPKQCDVKATLSQLADQGIQAGIGAAALHKEPAYRQWATRAQPGTEQCHASIIALPMPPGLSEGELDQVGEALARLV